MKNKFLNTILIIIGLTLSPITWWNDPFVNIPVSYLAGTVLAHFFPKLFTVSFLVFYWLTNILGIYLMHFGGRKLIDSARVNKSTQFITIIVYTIILLTLSVFGIIKPIILK